MTGSLDTFRDGATMLRRELRHMLRYRTLTVLLIGQPVIFLLLFVYVFGGTLGAGIGGALGSGVAGGSAGRTAYLEFVTPTMLIFTVAAAAEGAAIAVAMDLTTGIVARLRTMSIARSAILVGHAAGSVVQAFIGTAVVFAVALLIGFRVSTGFGSLVAAFALLVLVALALTWLCIGLGMATGNVEGASKVPMLIILLPFLGSGFVPTGSMPDALRLFAENQPFTSIIDTLRGLLIGTPGTASAPVAVAWCVSITVLGALWSMRLYERRSVM